MISKTSFSFLEILYFENVPEKRESIFLWHVLDDDEASAYLKHRIPNAVKHSYVVCMKVLFIF